MTENLAAAVADLKKHLSQSPNPGKVPIQPLNGLLDVYSDIVAFDRKLENYTVSKCAYERNMETCVLEYLYFNTRARQIIQEVKSCRHQDNKDLGECLKGVPAKVEALKAQVTGMIDVTKRELSS
jgi:hypothetical protein